MNPVQFAESKQSKQIVTMGIPDIMLLLRSHAVRDGMIIDSRRTRADSKAKNISSFQSVTFARLAKLNRWFARPSAILRA
jgi:hypothetical protein